MDTENTRIFLPENWSRDAVCIDPEVRPDYGFHTSGLGPGSYWQFKFRKKTRKFDILYRLCVYLNQSSKFKILLKKERQSIRPRIKEAVTRKINI